MHITITVSGYIMLLEQTWWKWGAVCRQLKLNNFWS